jgi:hypothetical protein
MDYQTHRDRSIYQLHRQGAERLFPLTNARKASTMSAPLVNKDRLIDLGPDIMVASQTNGRPLHQVRYCLQTHPHADRLIPSSIPQPGVRSSWGAGLGTLCLSSDPGMERVAETFERELADFSLLSPEAEKHLNFNGRSSLWNRSAWAHIFSDGFSGRRRPRDGGTAVRN